MYLTKIEIFGFKSFATKTKVIFNDGITAIVGPNGCGKTNIVDALRWVLGEQRYSTLRSDKMEDVIFNGTKFRKPIGLAEVALTIQNTKGILPMEYSDVTITRRIFRSGESEYLLNKTICRLKDIVTLFMDTGMGANAYSVIELKMVESILSERTEERRHLFEEAAGVTRYKTKRKEAYRRLEDVQNDLIRVNDIINEVEKIVLSLERQAKKAEKYNGLKERLHHLELDVLERDYSNLFMRLEPLQQRLIESHVTRQNLYEKVRQQETYLEELYNEKRDIESNVDLVKKNLNAVLIAIRENQQSVELNEERKKSFAQGIARARASIGEAQQRIHIESQKLDDLIQRKNSLSVDLIGQTEKYSSLKKSHEEKELSLAENKLLYSSLQSEQMKNLQSISQLNVELHSFDSTIVSLQKQLDRDKNELSENQESLSNKRSLFDQINTGEVELKKSVVDAERMFRDMENKQHQLKSEIDALQNRAWALQNQIGEKMTKIDFLNSLVDRMEGYSDSVQYLLSHHDWSTSKSVAVAEILNTNPELRTCIELVLGDVAHYLVVHDVAEAISGIERLKKSGKGKATFICVSRLPTINPIPFPIAGDGVIGWAIDLIRFSDEYKTLFNFIFKNVLIVRDSYTAHACIREYPSLKCVTVEGDIFQSDGVIRGGTHRYEEGGLIGKKEQIRELNEAVQKIKIELEQNQSLLQIKNREYNSIDLRNYADQIKSSQQQLSTHEKQIAQYVFEIEKYENSIEKLRSEIESIQQQIVDCNDRKNTLCPQLDELFHQKQDLEDTLKREMESLSQCEQVYSQSLNTLNESNIVIVKITAELKSVESEISRIQNVINETSDYIEKTSSEIIEAQRSIDALSDDNAQTEASLTVFHQEKDQIEQQLQDVDNQNNLKRDEIERVELLLRNDRENHTDSINLVHEIEMKVSEIQQKIESLKNYAHEELAFELERKHYQEEDVFDIAQAKEEIHILKGKIQSLGPINQLAYEEYQEEKKRLDFLTSQRTDLIEAEETLHETINEINKTAQEKFLTTFDLVCQNFIMIFKSLFEEGDEADLILTEPEDPLESRIDIIAKPRGKRPHSIEMLSGGEKTLTAIALLFAIYLVKPSPFCILDEVDAPLDDANIDRFIRIIKKFSENTQFIIVTHNKKTMEAADTLYGVTMEEEGVSKLVSVSFTENTVPAFSSN